MLSFTNTVGQATVRKSLSPLSPTHTFNPYSSVFSPISRHYSPLTVSLTTHTHSHSRRGRGAKVASTWQMLQPCLRRHGNCHACLGDGSILAIRWRYVCCFSLSIGLLPLHPSQQQGVSLEKSEPPFCSSLVPASSKTLVYLSLVLARLVPRPSRFMSVL